MDELHRVTGEMFFFREIIKEIVEVMLEGGHNLEY